jgi:hypothetical protein
MLLSLTRETCRCRAWTAHLCFQASVVLTRGARVSELSGLISDIANTAAAAHIKHEAPDA